MRRVGAVSTAIFSFCFLLFLLEIFLRYYLRPTLGTFFLMLFLARFLLFHFYKKKSFILINILVNVV